MTRKPKNLGTNAATSDQASSMPWLHSTARIVDIGDLSRDTSLMAGAVDRRCDAASRPLADLHLIRSARPSSRDGGVSTGRWWGYCRPTTSPGGPRRQAGDRDTAATRRSCVGVHTKGIGDEMNRRIEDPVGNDTKTGAAPATARGAHSVGGRRHGLGWLPWALLGLLALLALGIWGLIAALGDDDDNEATGAVQSGTEATAAPAANPAPPAAG